MVFVHNLAHTLLSRPVAGEKCARVFPWFGRGVGISSAAQTDMSGIWQSSTVSVDNFVDIHWGEALKPCQPWLAADCAENGQKAPA